LPRKEIVNQLINDVAPIFAERNGGYTRIIKLGFRDNDRASVSIIEFVDFQKTDEVKEVSKPD
jgi:large subunit ribosomal protein L17